MRHISRFFTIPKQCHCLFLESCSLYHQITGTSLKYARETDHLKCQVRQQCIVFVTRFKIRAPNTEGSIQDKIVFSKWLWKSRQEFCLLSYFNKLMAWQTRWVKIYGFIIGLFICPLCNKEVTHRLTYPLAENDWRYRLLRVRVRLRLRVRVSTLVQWVSWVLSTHVTSH